MVSTRVILIFAVIMVALFVFQVGAIMHSTSTQRSMQQELLQLRSAFDNKSVASTDSYSEVVVPLANEPPTQIVATQDTDPAISLTQTELAQIQTRESLDRSIQSVRLSSEELTTVTKKSLPAVLSIITDTRRGSGFLVHSSGLAITSYGIVSDATQVQVVLSDGSVHSANVIGYDENGYLAVIKVNANRVFPTLSLVSEQTSVGSRAIAIGNPQGSAFSVTEGIVLSRSRLDTRPFIRMSDATNPGNVGGPIMDKKGDVVGVITRYPELFSILEFGVPVESSKPALRAIPATYAIELLGQLLIN